MTGFKTPLDKLLKNLSNQGLRNINSMKDAILFVLYRNRALVDDNGVRIEAPDEPNYIYGP